MSENEENMADPAAAGSEAPAGAGGGRTSWEEPNLPFPERFRKHWRQMMIHLWGPIGSLVFHIIAIGVLVTCASGHKTEEVVSEPVVLEAKAQPELEKPPEPEKVKPPEPVEQQVDTPQ